MPMNRNKIPLARQTYVWVSIRWLGALALSAILAGSLSCSRHRGPSIPGEAPQEELPGCASTERRTARSTTKMICALPGGKVCTPDNKVCVDIPSLALEKDTEITLTLAGPEFQVDGKELLYPGARLDPDGLILRRSATAVLRPSGTADLGRVSLLLAKSSDHFEELAGIARGAGEIRGNLDHFSWIYPFVGGSPPAPNPPAIQVTGGPGGTVFGAVGNGATGSVGLRVVDLGSGLEWANSAGSSGSLFLQLDFPSGVTGKAYATLTMEDPGTAVFGCRAQQRWRSEVFDRIFKTVEVSGAIRASHIRWPQLCAGYPSGRVSAVIQYFDSRNNAPIGSSTLVLSVARP